MVLGELTGVLRLAFTFRLDGSAILGHEVTIALLWIFELALRVTLEALRVDAPLTLDLHGAPDVAAVLAAALGIAWLLAHLTRITFRWTLWLVSGYLPVVVMGVWYSARTCRKRRSRPSRARSGSRGADFFGYALSSVDRSNGGAGWE